MQRVKVLLTQYELMITNQSIGTISSFKVQCIRIHCVDEKHCGSRSEAS